MGKYFHDNGMHTLITQISRDRETKNTVESRNDIISFLREITGYLLVVMASLVDVPGTYMPTVMVISLILKTRKTSVGFVCFLFFTKIGVSGYIKFCL